VRIAPVFDKSQWPRLFESSIVRFKPKKDFFYPDEYSHFKKGVGYKIKDEEITAHLYNGAEIAFVRFEEGWLSQIEVKLEFRSHGIATELIRLAMRTEHLKGFKIACVRFSSSYQYSLTEEGSRLVASCIRKRILYADQCRGPGDVPLSDDASGDPGLVIAKLVRYDIPLYDPLSQPSLSY